VTLSDLAKYSMTRVRHRAISLRQQSYLFQVSDLTGLIRGWVQAQCNYWQNVLWPAVP